MTKPSLRLHDPLHLADTVERTPDARRKSQYAPRSAGKKYGMGICQFWAYLFELNELLPKKRKMTDEEIKRQVLAEFSGRKALVKLGNLGEKGRVTVNHYRQMYNMGRLTSNTPPKRRSYRFGLHGLRVDPRTGKDLPKQERKGARA